MRMTAARVLNPPEGNKQVPELSGRGAPQACQRVSVSGFRGFRRNGWAAQMAVHGPVQRSKAQAAAGVQLEAERAQRQRLAADYDARTAALERVRTACALLRWQGTRAGEERHVLHCGTRGAPHCTAIAGL